MLRFLERCVRHPEWIRDAAAITFELRAVTALYAALNLAIAWTMSRAEAQVCARWFG